MIHLTPEEYQAVVVEYNRQFYTNPTTMVSLDTLLSFRTTQKDAKRNGLVALPKDAFLPELNRLISNVGEQKPQP